MRRRRGTDDAPSRVPVMPRSWLTPLVIVFWCVANGWLVVEKILPTFQSRPPTGATALEAVEGEYIPVAWSVSWDDRPVGSLVSQARPLPGGGLAVESTMDLRRLPLEDLIPPWLKLMVRKTLPGGLQVSMTATGRLAVDAAGRLESFHTAVRLPETGETIFVTGTVEDGDVRVAIRARDLRFETSRKLPGAFALTDELSPHARLPGLTVGQRWTAPVFNPLRGDASSFEMLHAHVERETMTFADDEPVTARLVTFRDGSSTDAAVRLRLWVDLEGRVIRQEASIGASRLVFIRRSDAEAAALVEALAPAADRDSASSPGGAP